MPGREKVDQELERVLGLKEALAIGVGTMIGAGVFLFPGMAAGRTGLGAIFSFGIGGLIALLVALSTSELATSMPQSGGGYYFVSRGLGNFCGSVVGIGLWTGLIFAAAFYIVGFGYYAINMMSMLGIHISPIYLSFAMVLLLTFVGIIGTKNLSTIQTIIVSLLIIILLIFLLYGVLDTINMFGKVHLPEKLMPFGIFPIFTTAGLVFTSYLGFTQIASVAGEIKEPSKNLPMAMIGSVIIVAALYVSTIFVVTSAFGSATLASLGETALISVAKYFLGWIGSLSIIIAGMLATMSSTNATILGSSRVVFALSRDRVIPGKFSNINKRFKTPHISLILAGIAILFLVVIGNVQILAEVSSFIHLIMYTLICFSHVALRYNKPVWYKPTFKAPGYPLLPVLGGMASFLLVLFMNRLSQMIGIVILVCSIIWYFIYVKETGFEKVAKNEN